jgi:hypothetical protein
MSLPFVALAKNGGDEVGGGEDLKVALGGVVAFGAVDDGLAGGVPSDFLKGGVFAKATTPKEGMAEQILIRCAHPSRGHPPGALRWACSGSGRRG